MHRLHTYVGFLYGTVRTVRDVRECEYELEYDPYECVMHWKTYSTYHIYLWWMYVVAATYQYTSTTVYHCITGYPTVSHMAAAI